MTRVQNTVKSNCLIYIVDYLNRFCKALRDVDLVSTLNLVTPQLEKVRLKNVLQKKVTDFLNKTL